MCIIVAQLCVGAKPRSLTTALAVSESMWLNKSLYLPRSEQTYTTLAYYISGQMYAARLLTSRSSHGVLNCISVYRTHDLSTEAFTVNPCLTVDTAQRYVYSLEFKGLPCSVCARLGLALDTPSNTPAAVALWASLRQSRMWYDGLLWVFAGLVVIAFAISQKTNAMMR